MQSVWKVIGLGLVWTCLGACSDEPRASLAITAARVTRAPEGRVIVDVDVVAYEGLGGNVGIYCTRATFGPGTDDAVEVCAADLEDGDTKTVRLVSNGFVAPGAAIGVRVRLGRVDIGRSLAAPPY